jgi:hypothetical protein
MAPGGKAVKGFEQKLQVENQAHRENCMKAIDDGCAAEDRRSAFPSAVESAA